MSHFVKLYASILDSTIWAEPAPTVKVWLTMLAMADANGFVEGSITGVMRRAIVSREECEIAINVLESPDPDSKTPDHEGRRIERVDGGWKILNHRKYRDLRTETQIAVAQRVKQHRDKKKALQVTDVTKVTRRNRKKRDVRPEVEVDVETTRSTTSAPKEPDVTCNTPSNGQRPLPWPVEGAAIWSAQVAEITPARFGAAMKLTVDKNGWPDAKAGMECYIDVQSERARKIEWYAGESVKWIRLAKMPIVDPETRELTEKGRKVWNG